MRSRLWKGAVLAGLSVALGVAGGYWFAQQRMNAMPGADTEQAPKTQDERKALYW